MIKSAKRHAQAELHRRLRTVQTPSGHLVYKTATFRSVVVDAIAHVEGHSPDLLDLLPHSSLVYCVDAVTRFAIERASLLEGDLREKGLSQFDLAEVVQGDPAFLTLEGDGTPSSHGLPDVPPFLLPPIIEIVHSPRGASPATVPVVVYGEISLWLAWVTGRNCSCLVIEGPDLIDTPHFPFAGHPGTDRLSVSNTPIKLPRGYGYSYHERRIDSAFHGS